MLLDFKQLVKKYNLQFERVCQVGAHFGQEYLDYIQCGATEVVFIEPCKKAFKELQNRFSMVHNVRLINYACGAPEDPELMEMFTGDETVNKGMSNSLLKPKTHLVIHPEVEFTEREIVKVWTLDLLWLPVLSIDLLVLDCQGYELKVLKGATENLENVKYIYTEVNKDEVYEGCAKVDELDFMLSDFKRVETGRWVRNSWTDAFYIRRGLL